MCLCLLFQRVKIFFSVNEMLLFPYAGEHYVKLDHHENEYCIVIFYHYHTIVLDCQLISRPQRKTKVISLTFTIIKAMYGSM